MNTYFLKKITKMFPNHMELGCIVTAYANRINELGDDENTRKIIEHEILTKFSKT